MTRRSRLVISIDGGGIRGVIPLIILKQIQKRFSRDLFQQDISWWGTSTGALISGALGIQSQVKFEEAIQNVLDIYEFRSSAAVQPRGVSIPTRALNQLIQSNFSNLHLNQFPNLNIVVSDANDLSPVIFNAKNSCPLDEAIAASCAFPGVYPAVKINDTLYVDGFFNAKNPTRLAHENNLQGTADITYLSLGTGIMRESDAVEEEVEAVHLHMKNLQDEGQLNYFRFNPRLVNATDSMQNTSAKNILALRKDALSYIAENENEIQRLIKVLG
ncbi:MAG: putative acylesterase/phospholipase RssA [Crocinitomix sp.]|jgi:predicted acylesterase/phospholipase RssA